VSIPAGERRKPGTFNRSKMLALLKRQARARKHGEKPEPARRWTSAMIMRAAGQVGMLSVRRARWVCWYRWGTPSRYEPGCGAR